MLNISNTYKKLPAPVKDILKYGYSRLPLRLRLGKKFYRELKFLQQSQWWSREEMQAYQDHELTKLISHAVKNVPYYRDLFRQLKLTPDDIQCVDDLQKLPILTKDIIRENVHRLRADGYTDDQVITCSTSGSTGKPLKFYYDKDKDYLNFDPYIWRFFNWGGHKIGKLGAKLADWTLPGEAVHAYNPVRDLLILSAYHLQEDKAEEYALALAQYQVEYIDTYPSALVLLTKFLKAKNFAPPCQLKAVFSHSEMLHNWQRQIIEEYWGCKCYDWYGMEERAILGIECEQHQGLHLCSDFAITEFVPHKETKGDKIIATSLTNYAMPFIRYDTGDVGVLKSQACSCNRPFPLFELHGGRRKNFAVGKDGANIPIANIDIPNATDNVIQFQFVQKNKGELDLHIIRKNDFNDSDIKKINDKLSEKFGQNMDINIEFTSQIQKTGNGKTALFVQKLKPESNLEIA
ncbi:hypothetical protein [Thalassomonas sp. RHCl1]|uniref:phenylacetate--CoA ligase family protein n=1 Tax=Thalassomonas sp. RHCl1 TaxID=2995320 RepID=UPI00248B1118|nr:hypothetical protein [Thalassomonas sp. RHCl1]